MKKQVLNEQFRRMQKLAGIMNEDINQSSDPTFTMSFEVEVGEDDILCAVKFKVLQDKVELDNIKPQVKIVNIIDAKTKQSVMDQVSRNEIMRLEDLIEGDDFVDWNEFTPVESPGNFDPTEPVPGDDISLGELSDDLWIM